MSALNQHKNWAGSAAFSEHPTTKLLVGSFQAFARRSPSRNEMFNTPEECLAFLETLHPGLTHGIDWEKVLADEV